jgi:ESCRT-I complex subunit TSG101
MLTMSINLMKSWFCENEIKAAWIREDGEIEKMFQILDDEDVSDDVIADNSIDDTIDALYNAMQEGCVPFDAYLKSVRALSRDKFFHQEAQRKQRD